MSETRTTDGAGGAGSAGSSGGSRYPGDRRPGRRRLRYLLRGAAGLLALAAVAAGIVVADGWRAFGGAAAGGEGRARPLRHPAGAASGSPGSATPPR